MLLQTVLGFTSEGAAQGFAQLIELACGAQTEVRQDTVAVVLRQKIDLGKDLIVAATPALVGRSRVCIMGSGECSEMFVGPETGAVERHALVA